MSVTYAALLDAATEENNHEALECLRNCGGDINRIPNTMLYLMFQGVSEWFDEHGLTPLNAGQFVLYADRFYAVQDAQIDQDGTLLLYRSDTGTIRAKSIKVART